MVSKFAIGFAIFMNSKALWSMELTNKYNENNCFEFEHREIQNTQLKITNDDNIHLVYLETKTLYVFIPNTEIHRTSLNYLRLQEKKKTKKVIYLRTEHFKIISNGSCLCISQTI